MAEVFRSHRINFESYYVFGNWRVKKYFDFSLPSGFFFEPTVFTDVQDHMYIATEESFGPVMIISRFPNE